MSVKVVKTRKIHQCYFCAEYINKGEQAKTERVIYSSSSGHGSYFDTEYYHMNCPMENRV